MGKRSSFDYCRLYDFQEFRLSPDTNSEVRGYFTNLRVDPKTLPEGWYLYEIMGTDNGSIGHGVIQEHVLANFVGSFLTKTPVRFTSKVFNRFSPDKSRNGIFCTTKVKTKVDLRKGEILNWEKKRYHINSYTFGFDVGDSYYLDEDEVNKAWLAYEPSDATIGEFLANSPEFKLTEHDIFCMMVEDGYDPSDPDFRHTTVEDVMERLREHYEETHPPKLTEEPA